MSRTVNGWTLPTADDIKDTNYDQEWDQLDLLNQKVAAVVNTSGAITDGTVFAGYNVTSKNVGTVQTGSTVVERGDGIHHTSVITVATNLGAIAGGADLGLGKKLYIFPAGEIIVKSAYMSIALDEDDGNITADTPEVGLGTVVASGAVNVLSGTATFENILTGQAAADCNGTATVKTVADQVLVIATAGAHDVFFNAADGWAASGEDDCAIAGTVVLEWQFIA
jgi:hypothetical protein